MLLAEWNVGAQGDAESMRASKNYRSVIIFHPLYSSISDSMGGLVSPP